MRDFWAWLRGGWLRTALRRLETMAGGDDERLSSGAQPPEGARRAGRRAR